MRAIARLFMKKLEVQDGVNEIDLETLHRISEAVDLELTNRLALASGEKLFADTCPSCQWDEVGYEAAFASAKDKFLNKTLGHKGEPV